MRIQGGGVKRAWEPGARVVRRGLARAGSSAWLLMACACAGPAPLDTAEPGRDGWAPMGPLDGGSTLPDASGSGDASQPGPVDLQADGGVSRSSMDGGPDNDLDAAARDGGAGDALVPTRDGGDDAALCQTVELTPSLGFEPANLLIIFDRSISMSDPFPDMGSATTRLEATQQAIQFALSPLTCPDDDPDCQDGLNVALLTFPTYDGVSGVEEGQLSCTVDGLDSDEQLGWRSLTQFAADFGPYWDARPLVDGGLLFPGLFPLVFGTPIPIAFARADEVLTDPSLVGDRAVLFLTDGEETGACSENSVIATAQQWYDDLGIQTHVVGIGQIAGSGQQFNDEVAAAGGTGQASDPTDQDQLADEISRVVVASRGGTSCEVPLPGVSLNDLEKACELGLVSISSTLIPCVASDAADGFIIDDATSLRLVGTACTALREAQNLRAAFPCDLVDSD